MTASVIVLPGVTSCEGASQTSPAGSQRLRLDLAQRLALGTRLTELREERGLTQLQVAQQALGFAVSHAAVSRLERGVLPAVDDGRLEKLAAFYGETIASLLANINGREDAREADEFRSVDGLTVEAGFGARLYNMRQAAGLTRAQLAALLGYGDNGPADVTQWERATVTPHPDTMLHIACVMGVSAAWLIVGRRAKPAAPTLPMRLRAMQKLYGLTNREVATLAEMDLERGRATVAALSRGRFAPSAKTLANVAKALDVPEDWIRPPQQGYAPSQQTASPGTREDLSPAANKFLGELADLFAMNTLGEADIAGLRNRFIRELMSGLRHAKAA